MHGPCPARRVHGGGPLPAAWLSPLSALTALTGCSEAAAGGAPWLFGTVALLLAGGSGYAIGHLRARRAAEAALRGSRRDAQALAELLEGWSWQTDDSHRLLRLQPPAAAPADAWSRATGAGSLAWEHFDTAEPGGTAGLRARLESRLPFSDLRVRSRGGGVEGGWLLRAAPRFDDLGRFAGYTGSARPTGEIDAKSADQGALQALLAALEVPAVLAWGDGTPAGWRLRHANAAALRLLDTQTTDWSELLARLPAALREAIAGAPAGAASESEGWSLRRFDSNGSAGLLLLQTARDEATNGEGASFGFTVSHDLRAPIRVVEGFTRILKEDYGRQLDRVGNDHLDRVLGAAARMNHMIDALLTLAKLSQQPLARQPVNLSQLAGYVVDDLRRASPERAADIEIEPALHAQGDPTLLRLVLENLLANAWKYTARCKKAHIVFGATVHEGRRAYVVRDNGAGFDMRSADRLFGLFQRLHSANDFPGTGVGLASVKRIVRRHGGEVWADAEPGRGAAFHFTLRE
jgi:signal transduction histidine kinase